MCINRVYIRFMRKSAHKRINITLPEETVALLEQVAGKGSRSTFIDDAIKAQIKKIKEQNLSDQLKEGAIARAERNLQMAKEWSQLEDEVWQKYL